MQEEAKLETWGFAKTDERDEAQTDPREKLSIAKINTIAFTTLIAQEIDERELESLAITISFVGGGALLDRYINEVEEEESMQETVAIASNQDENTKTVDETYKVEISQPAIVDVQKIPESYRIPNYEAISAKRAPLNLDLGDARRVALGEILPTSNVYFIQLAALSKTSGNVNQFKSLSKYGNLYKVFKSTSTKIKLGYFLDKSEASSVLKNVKAQGYKDAFITKDDLGALQLELIVANDKQNSSYTSYDAPGTGKINNKTSSGNNKNNNEYTLHNTARNSYKIRLASYEDPIWFDIEKAKKLGKIEQWTKGSWTIFILGGYNSYEAAEQARVKAVNKGFADAEIVIDNNGILERLKQN